MSRTFRISPIFLTQFWSVKLLEPSALTRSKKCCDTLSSTNFTWKIYHWKDKIMSKGQFTRDIMLLGGGRRGGVENPFFRTSSLVNKLNLIKNWNLSLYRKNVGGSYKQNHHLSDESKQKYKSSLFQNSIENFKLFYNISKTQVQFWRSYSLFSAWTIPAILSRNFFSLPSCFCVAAAAKHP